MLWYWSDHRGRPAVGLCRTVRFVQLDNRASADTHLQKITELGELSPMQIPTFAPPSFVQKY